MDSAIRQRALRSAAKVAFGASVCWGAALTGCGGKSVYGAEEGPDDAELGGGSGTLATGGATAGGAVGGSRTGGGVTGGSPTGGRIAMGGGVAAGGTTGGSVAVGGTGGIVATGGTGGSVATGGTSGGGVAAGGSGPSGGDAGLAGTGAGPQDGGSELACTAPLGETAPLGGWDFEAYSCCAAFVNAKAPEGVPDPRKLASDPSFVNCCRYVTRAYYSLRTDAGGFVDFPLPIHTACCTTTVLGDEAHQGFCAPWGPPVPPALPTELEVA